jgi:hypothetical protein
MADSTSSSNDASTGAVSAPQYTLVVKEPFGDYSRGDAITDSGIAAAVLAGENSRHVNKIANS